METTKICSVCKEEKFLSAFPKRTKSRDGYAAQCKGCKRIIDNNHYSSSEGRREAIRASNHAKTVRAMRYLREYLTGKLCMDCGEDDPRVLQFDHRDPTTKTANISNLVGQGYSTARIQAEIDLCDIRCANCHARRTADQFGWYTKLVLASTPS